MSSGEQTTGYIPLVPDSDPQVQLVLQERGQDGTEIRCRRVVTLIGSRSGCKIVLKHKRIAPVHVAIINDGAHPRAIDLITPGGSFLNDLKMENEELNDGDRLQTGPWEFRVQIGPPRSPQEAHTRHFDLDPTPHVVALEHLATGRLLQPNRDFCIIGRRKGCDISLSETRVSRVHALLVTYHGHPALVDLISTHQTLVNGEPIAFRVLKDEDMVTIGESRFRVRVVGSSVGRTASTDGKSGGTPEMLVPPDVASPSDRVDDDHVDIGTVEGARRWTIADKAEKAARKQGN